MNLECPTNFLNEPIGFNDPDNNIEMCSYCLLNWFTNDSPEPISLAADATNFACNLGIKIADKRNQLQSVS